MKNCSAVNQRLSLLPTRCCSPDVLHVGYHVEEELLGEAGLAGDHDALERVAVLPDDGEDGGVAQHRRVAHVECTQPV